MKGSLVPRCSGVVSYYVWREVSAWAEDIRSPADGVWKWAHENMMHTYTSGLRR